MRIRASRVGCGRSEECCPQLEAQNRFNRDAVKPLPRTGGNYTSSRRARVRRGAIHVGAHHIRLNFVVLRLLSRRGMVDRVDEIPKFRRGRRDPARCRQGNPSGSVVY